MLSSYRNGSKPVVTLTSKSFYDKKYLYTAKEAKKQSLSV